ncbi:hypothetical protein Vafri_21465 [Volvox africanus]|uniref:Secreted protein n=1 Tax=Volvox africanus TaxID=51714 RepID=A0A8J4BZ01_9CHLO|nr:hypothetical protein Vafri_21465 [Volvox africanus]
MYCGLTVTLLQLLLMIGDVAGRRGANAVAVAAHENCGSVKANDGGADAREPSSPPPQPTAPPILQTLTVSSLEAVAINCSSNDHDTLQMRRPCALFTRHNNSNEDGASAVAAVTPPGAAAGATGVSAAALS